MKKATTRQTYAKRIESVIELIWSDPLKDWNLLELADHACFSPYHFHRIYKQMCGETVHKTMRRLRMHFAGALLQRPDTHIHQTAQETGYRSTESFSRAFQQTYGVSPSQWIHQLNQKERKNMHTVKIENMKPQRLFGIDHTGPYMQIGAAFDKLYAWGAGKQTVLNEKTRLIGIFYDDPTHADPTKLRSTACISAPENASSDREDIQLITLKGGRHATLKFIGPYSQLEQAYQWLYGRWLPESGEEPADRPCFEIYLNDPKDTPPQALETLICMPLK
ncbi:MAG TPA: hypothetical protein DCZ12_18255 [Gammaproteobacteria bacterium]|nr:hypothetical protein [Gammaproteobacteria bacterium]